MPYWISRRTCHFPISENSVLEGSGRQAGEIHPADLGAYTVAFHILPDDGDSLSGTCGEDRRFSVVFHGKGEAIRDFRRSRNGVLFASDSAGEGIDLAGNILSSLVMVKLPFPVPEPVLEYEKSLYEDFHEYQAEIIVPAMLMKLRQWIGRGIRREMDTCAFSILDCRSSGRYKNDILAALPDMPVTERLDDVGIFIRSNKPERYSMDGE